MYTFGFFQQFKSKSQFINVLHWHLQKMQFKTGIFSCALPFIILMSFAFGTYAIMSDIVQQDYGGVQGDCRIFGILEWISHENERNQIRGKLLQKEKQIKRLKKKLLKTQQTTEINGIMKDE